MSDRPAARTPDDLLPFLSGYLRAGGPRFLLVAGPVGSGKSSLLRALYDRLETGRIFLLYQQPQLGPSASSAPPASAAAAHFLLVGARAEPSGAADRTPSTMAGLPADAAAAPGLQIPAPLAEALTAIEAGGTGTVLTDSWDRGTERFVRGLADASHPVSTFSLDASDFGAVQSAILELRVNLVLAVIPELAAPLQSLGDALVQLREDERAGVRLRIVAIPKIRGSSMESREFLYSLEGGKFQSFPDLPRGFVPPIAAADPDPEPESATVWPGSRAFAGAFGRLRLGGFSAVTVAPDCPDQFLTPCVRPVAAHVLASGGRVVWMPSPSVRPSRLLAALKDGIPVDWLRERLRIVSASGDDPGLGDLRSTVLPLRRESAGHGDVRAATSPGVGPIFPDAHRFLSGAAEGKPALYVLSLEGLKASVSTAGLTLDPATLPAVLAAYGRIPRFLGFGYGRSDDPLATPLLPLMDTVIQIQVACGRPVLCGLRPRTAAFVMDWSADGTFSLVPM